MHQRRRRLAVGMVLVALASGGAWSIGTSGTERHVAGAERTPPAIGSASVAADGSLATAEPGWRARRVAAGTYLVELPVPAAIELRTWTTVAGVTARPVSTTAWSIAFTNDGAPVDSAFTFRASPTG